MSEQIVKVLGITVNNGMTRKITQEELDELLKHKS